MFVLHVQLPVVLSHKLLTAPSLLHLHAERGKWKDVSVTEEAIDDQILTDKVDFEVKVISAVVKQL